MGNGSGFNGIELPKYGLIKPLPTTILRAALEKIINYFFSIDKIVKFECPIIYLGQYYFCIFID